MEPKFHIPTALELDKKNLIELFVLVEINGAKEKT